MIFYVHDPASPRDVDFAVLCVDDPGRGSVTVCGLHRSEATEHRCDYNDKHVYGVDLGLALDELTSLAIRDPLESVVGTVHRLGSMTVGEARLLLPSFQRAVLLAAAGTNRYEATAEDAEAAPTFCTTCGEGEMYTTSECRSPQRSDGSCARTDWCDQFGHSWFAGRKPEPAAVPS